MGDFGADMDRGGSYCDNSSVNTEDELGPCGGERASRIYSGKGEVLLNDPANSQNTPRLQRATLPALLGSVGGNESALPSH